MTTAAAARPLRDSITLNPGPLAPRGAVAIPLTQGLWTWIDAADADRVSERKWQAHWCSARRMYRAISSAYADGRKVTVWLSRLILNAPPGMVADHIGGSETTLDNRRSNLRLATYAENNRNRGLGRDNTSGFRGVSYRDPYWRAVIYLDGRQRNLGYFRHPIAAARAFDAAVAKYHGEFGRTNVDLGLLPPLADLPDRPPAIGEPLPYGEQLGLFGGSDVA